MKTRSRANPVTEWVRVTDAFDAIVAHGVFDRAQAILRAEAEAARIKFSSGDMLAKLKQIHAKYGVVTPHLVAAADDMVSPATYAHRFQSMALAFQAVFGDVIRQRSEQAIAAIREAALEVRPVDDFWVVENRFSILIQPIVPMARGYEASWDFHPDQRHDVDLTIGIPLSCPRDFEVLGYLAFPRLMCRRRVRISSTTWEAVELYGHSLQSLIQEIMK